MQDIKNILTQLGYSLTPDKDGWRTSAIYRSGDNPTALKVYSNGFWQDFVDNTHGNLEDLISLTLGDKEKAKEYIKGHNIVIDIQTPKDKLKVPEFFNSDILKELIPDFSYWEKRGISIEVSKLFTGGLCLESQGILGKMKGRQILVIYDSRNNIIGLTGRSLDDKNKIKWRHLGQKANWVWPAYMNNKIIKELKQILIVESPVDVLKMWECDIKNVICLFGTDLSHAVLNYLLKVNPKSIIISTNNEASGVGNEAAEKIYNRLKRYFNKNQLQIILPYKKDFGEMSCEEIRGWMKDNAVYNAHKL